MIAPQHIHADSGPASAALSQPAPRCPSNVLDTQVLFHPFDEQLDLPAIAPPPGHGVCGQGEVLRRRKSHSPCVFVPSTLTRPTRNSLRVVGGALGAGQDDGLVTHQAGGFIKTGPE